MSTGDRLRRAFVRLPPGLRRRILHGLRRYAPWEPGFDFTPPPPGAGQRAAPPDFVGIGVQKAGTTWWYEQIVAHPDVFAPRGAHKERHFFDRFGARPMSPADTAAYHGWFPRPPGMLAGEWTPDYFTYPWVPRLLARAAPETRLLLLLRDPVERFRSGLAHDARMGTSVDGVAIGDAIGRGHYRAALDAWLEHFDASQLLVLQHERCVTDPTGQLARTFAHLGLDPVAGAGADPRAQVAPDLVARSTASTGRARRELGAEVVDELVRLYEPGVVALAGAIDDLDVELWPNFAYLAGADRTPGPSSPTSRR
jgi:sulfotransferase family protein